MSGLVERMEQGDSQGCMPVGEQTLLQAAADVAVLSVRMARARRAAMTCWSCWRNWCHRRTATMAES
ncbi:hypothetical protein [Streptomyces griseofuscus]|uniref:hypothetical protein n=1 Tax=Streptomyces griseofuscus TaxID=146922 RepID=UPI0033FF8109